MLPTLGFIQGSSTGCLFLEMIIKINKLITCNKRFCKMCKKSGKFSA